jgi:hypothetical protein
MTDDRFTWELVIESARSLERSGSPVFQLSEMIRAVQNLDGTRGRGSIQPVIQGMTINAGKGPAQSCGKVFRRVGHGQYEFL